MSACDLISLEIPKLSTWKYKFKKILKLCVYTILFYTYVNLLPTFVSQPWRWDAKIFKIFWNICYCIHWNEI